MDIIDRKSNEANVFFSALEEMLDCIEQALQNRTPHLRGEKFLTGREVCQMLHVSGRTLQQWRTERKIACIRLSGKILYRHSDIEKLLNENYSPAVQTHHGFSNL
jgi:hypothetical protein